MSFCWISVENDISWAYLVKNIRDLIKHRNCYNQSRVIVRMLRVNPHV